MAAVNEAKGILHFNNDTYHWEIHDLDQLKKQKDRRMKNNNAMYYDRSRVRSENASLYPESPEYKNAIGLSASIQDSIDQTKSSSMNSQSNRLRSAKALIS